MIQLSKSLAISVLSLALISCTPQVDKSIYDAQVARCNQLNSDKYGLKLQIDDQNRQIKVEQTKNKKIKDLKLQADNQIAEAQQILEQNTELLRKNRIVESENQVIKKFANSGIIYQLQETTTQTKILLLFILMCFLGAITWIYFSFKLKLEDRLSKNQIKSLGELKNLKNEVTHAMGELDAARAIKSALIDELDQLRRYENIDNLKETAKIIAEAHKEAKKITTDAKLKINAQVATIKTELSEERNELENKRQELEQRTLELDQKEADLKELARSLIE